MKNKIKSIIGLSILISSQAMSVPWCHRGTIVQVADVVWSGSTTTAMAGSIPVPTSVTDPERYQVSHATDNYCQTFAGGGGPSWGYQVPGAGTVATHIYAPYILTNTVNNYYLSMGVSFKCQKCYALPPYVQVHDFEKAVPLPGIEGKVEYEVQIEER